MKWIISLILLMCMPISVIQFSSESHEKLIAYRTCEMMISQVHSVSHTPVIDYFTLDYNSILLTRTEYDDQGGAGMPNESNVAYREGFYIERNEKYVQLFLVLDEDNTVQIDQKKYKFIGTYELSVGYTPAINFMIHRIGEL